MMSTLKQLLSDAATLVWGAPEPEKGPCVRLPVIGENYAAMSTFAPPLPGHLLPLTVRNYDVELDQLSRAQIVPMSTDTAIAPGELSAVEKFDRTARMRITMKDYTDAKPGRLARAIAEKYPDGCIILLADPDAKDSSSARIFVNLTPALCLQRIEEAKRQAGLTADNAGPSRLAL